MRSRPLCAGLITVALLSSPLRALDAPAPDALTADGGRYFGPLVNGKLHGVGRLEWEDGSRYEGEFAEGLMSGKGRRQDLAGRIYMGQFVAGLLHGKGRIETPEGDVYEGDFVRNRFTGQGTYRGPDGAHYQGQFLEGRFHGQGLHRDASGAVHEGSFVHGEFSGQGRMQGPEGWRYEGQVKDWQPHGHGTLYLANGDIYRGGFADGQYHGEGVLTRAKPSADGLKEERGLWRMGQLENAARALQAESNVEAALYHQRRLLDSAIGALKPRDPGAVNMYVLAIAGDGKSDVFQREVDFVSEQFNRRFAAAGHVLTLVNGRATATSRPMATLTSIQESLKAIAARMDKQRDILFLYITSHGTKKHEIVLDSEAMRLRDLTGAHLESMLRDSGIRWKVVVISACFSGGLIDTLRDDSTLIITAARHDRASFGCGTENDFTYFGRAFFKESLPQARSFQEAYQRAEDLVRQWEMGKLAGSRREEEHSLPQIVEPPPIQAHLRQWWAQQSAASRSVSGVSR